MGDMGAEPRAMSSPPTSVPDQMVQVELFGDCALRGTAVLERAAAEGKAVEMENFFSRFALDIIGKAVFNYEFDSLTTDDPVIQVGRAGCSSGVEGVIVRLKASVLVAWYCGFKAYSTSVPNTCPASRPSRP